MLRDVFTVTRGEKVNIHTGGRFFAEGYYIGIDAAEGYILIDAPRLGPDLQKVSVYSTWIDVIDSRNNCLGLVEPEPDLRGAAPDLE